MSLLDSTSVGNMTDINALGILKYYNKVLPMSYAYNPSKHSSDSG